MNAAQLEEQVNRVLSRRALDLYEPYEKQKEFHAAGSLPGIRERLLKAGNQLGKTLGAGNETAMHLTGKYPDWWVGHRFTHPVSGWVGSPTGQTVRDNAQRILLGRPENIGTGAIPYHDLVDMKKAAGNVPDLIETIVVRHVTGGTSTITLKTYDQGRIRWQGESLDFVWFDEEPPQEIYSEGCTRTVATHGIVYMTFTPLLGMSDVVRRFLKEKPPMTHVTSMTIYDAKHFTDEQREQEIARYPAHEREARALGIPIMGSGRVFDTDEKLITVPAFPIAPHWSRLAAMDIGFDHPTACVWLAWDKDTDIVYLYDAYRVSKEIPAVHAAAIRSRGSWIPVMWPHDALQHEKGSGVTIANQYRALQVSMHPEKATHAPERGKPEGTGGYSFEAGILDMMDRMKTGRLKVFKHLVDWFEEYRLYHREKGLVVKEQDDLMSATRIGLMMLRHAKSSAQVGARRASLPGYQPTDVTMGVLG